MEMVWEYLFEYEMDANLRYFPPIACCGPCGSAVPITCALDWLFLLTSIPLSFPFPHTPVPRFYSEHPVLISESPMNPRKNRERIAEIMFEKFDVPALYVRLL